KSVAVLGANNVKGTVPHDIVMNIARDDFQGILYPVSPKERSIAGIRSYKYIVDIPHPVDLAVIVFPSSVCDLAMEQCGKKGVKSAIIISAGFKETGQGGFQREKKIKEIAARYHISFIGPNCLGVINTDPSSHLNASFARKMPAEGSIAFLSQSGALCTAVLDYARARRIGFSKFVSFGNKADISEIDLLYYLKDDVRTKVILLYLEEITDGKGIMEAAREIIAKTSKPILALKSGRTPEGAKAASSHTGSLAGKDEIVDAAFRQSGIIRCYTIEDMFNKAIAMAYQPLPRNNRVAIITNAGGPGVLATDAAINDGLQLAPLNEKTLEILSKNLPRTANIKNPIDVIGDARSDRYKVALEAVMNDDNVDGALAILTPQSMTDIKGIAREITRVAQKHEKPLYASFMGEADVAAGVAILQKNKIPHYNIPEDMCAAFAVSAKFKKHLEHVRSLINNHFKIKGKKSAGILKQAIRSKRNFLTEDESNRFLKAFELPVLDNGLARTPAESVKIAQRIGYPVVMKIVSDDIIHKSDIGGVYTHITNSSEVKKGFQSIISNVKKHQPRARIKGIFISKMITGGEEVIIGLKQDPSFGPVIMFGLGGIFVEVFKDVSFRVAPVDDDTVLQMIRETKSFPVLSGARKRTIRDIESIKKCIMNLSELAMAHPEIKELDINPLLVLEEGKGCFVADAKIML
ncbi:MAG: acetate--CoA ligase family protein, partial [Spirochaetes bacterium]|nr:acetate--CoA ligase family protein [Spirochaetota bacterium]